MPRSTALPAVAAVFALSLGASPLARAQAPDPPTAAELFRQGRDALDAMDYPVACAKLLDSLRLDVHVGTLISLGECEQGLGKLATARLRMQQAAQLARRLGDDRAKYCEDRFDVLDMRVPRLTIRIAPGAAPGTFVRKDSVDVGASELGVALPIEVGKHMIVGLARFHDTRSYEIEAKEGDRLDVVVEPGGFVPDLLIAPEDLPPTGKPPPPLPRPRENPLRTSAYVSGALGLAGVGFGTYFGLKAIAGAKGAPGHCTGNACDAVGAVVRRDAVQTGNLATGTFAVAGALLAGSVVFYVLSGSW
ncbi:MAG TPA: hypothetical protein VGL81_14380 [Polyangiaceae bacterium]|jgi:hypothetical protein